MLLRLVVLLPCFLILEPEVANLALIYQLLGFFLTLGHMNPLLLLFFSVCNLRRLSIRHHLLIDIMSNIFVKNIFGLLSFLWKRIHSCNLRKLVFKRQRRIRISTWRSSLCASLILEFLSQLGEKL